MRYEYSIIYGLVLHSLVCLQSGAAAPNKYQVNITTDTDKVMTGHYSPRPDNSPGHVTPDPDSLVRLRLPWGHYFTYACSVKMLNNLYI